MTWVAAAIGGSAILGYLGSQSAANTQASAANNASGTQWNMYQQNRADNQPWRDAGNAALGQLNTAMAPGGSLNKSFSMSDFTQDPGYQFRLQQGQQALDRAAASKGMNLSGAQLKATAAYGQNMGTQNYQQSLQNWNAQNTNQFNRLSSMAGLGQQANAMNQQSGTNAANNIAQNTMSAGNASAAGTIGGYNAINNGVNQAINYNNSNNMWNALSGSNNSFTDPNAGSYSSFSNPYGYGV